MRYMLSKEFTKISATSGTVQNISRINTLEMSTSTVQGSGLLLSPLQKHTFSNLGSFYLRCVDGQAGACVVPFFVDVGGGFSSDGSISDFDDFTQEDVDDVFKD